MTSPGGSGEAEIWALCGACDRWFYCEGWFDVTTSAPTCPVCAADPSAVVNGATCSAAEAADVRAAVLHHRAVPYGLVVARPG